MTYAPYYTVAPPTSLELYVNVKRIVTLANISCCVDKAGDAYTVELVTESELFLSGFSYTLASN